MAKLYNPNACGQYVWQVYRLDDKAKPPKTLYVADPSSDWSSTGAGLQAQHGPVGDSGWPVGKYDDEGFYCTHLPPVPNAEGARGLSRYVRHPAADEQLRQDYERDLINTRHGPRR